VVGSNICVDFSFLKISVCGLGYWFNFYNIQKFKIGLQAKRIFFFSSV
jgi:hypothetical protein